jgi:saccharopine dehydrogenase-like NADP-dependent oxidoreductase
MACIAVLGVGAAGEVAVRHLARGNVFREVVAADVRPERLKAVRRRARSRRLRIEEADFTDESDIRRVCRGAHVILNCALPNFNLPIMEQALRQRAHYIDLASMGSPDPNERSKVLDQLKLDRQFRRRDLTAILGLGVAPGITNLLASLASQRIGALEEVRIRVYGSGYAQVEGYSLAPLFSPETFLEEVLFPAPVWRDGRLEKLPPFSGYEVYRFPDPLGPATCYNVNNEETEMMPRFISSEIRLIDFKYAIAPERKALIEGLYRIGLTGTEPIPVNGREVVPFDVLLALLPHSETLVDKVRGHTCVLVEVATGGGQIRRRFWTVLSHSEARRRHGVTATAYLTGTPPAAAAEGLKRGLLRRRGVTSAGGVETRPLLQALLRRGVPLFEGDPSDARGVPLVL